MSYPSGMPQIARLRVTWTGSAVVGGGLSTFYTLVSDVAGLPAAVQTFFTSLAPLVPTTLQWTIPRNGDTIDDGSGELTGTWSEAGADLVVNSSLAGAYPNGVGARVVWVTSGIHRGRRVRGATFICPLASGSFQSDGTLTDANVTTIRNAATTLVAAKPLRIFSRPQPGAADGASNPVISSTVPDKVSWLRSRRT